MAILATGTAAPMFKGMNLTGPEINLENYKGKKAVVLIFAPDRVDPTQTNAVKTLANKVKDKVELITASRKVPSVSMAKAFLQQLGVKFPTLYDPSMVVYRLYGVRNPVAIFGININSVIVFSAEADPDKVDLAQVEEAISESLNDEVMPRQVQCPNCRGFKTKRAASYTESYMCDLCGYRWEPNLDEPPQIGADSSLIQKGAEHLRQLEEAAAEAERKRREAAAEQRRREEAAAMAAFLWQQQHRK
jgi:peroxiredoxin/predicted RNA-binding Zn-ribbon protein involved in translation (DUF1610 family)